MCPACWATALTAFAGLSAVSVLAIALKDRWILNLAIALGILMALQRSHQSALLDWVADLVAALLLVRVSLLLAKACRGPTMRKGWRQACTIAAKTCKKKQL